MRYDKKKLDGYQITRPSKRVFWKQYSITTFTGMRYLHMYIKIISDDTLTVRLDVSCYSNGMIVSAYPSLLILSLELILPYRISNLNLKCQVSHSSIFTIKTLFTLTSFLVNFFIFLGNTHINRNDVLFFFFSSRDNVNSIIARSILINELENIFGGCRYLVGEASTA